jgi:glycine hydroxymethyltransferase
MNAAETPFWGPDFAELSSTDPEIADVVLGELDRLRGGLQLIASENFTSPAVLAALGSTLSNKYAEGYPGRRYYGGCQQVDRAEEIGRERARELFGSPGVDVHVNLQPHSGASANLATYAALLQPGDTVLAMSLPHGGHLTHGSKVSFSGTWFRPVSYTVRRDTELIDYDEVRDLAHTHRPKMIIAGATAYPRLIDFARFREIADDVGAWLVVDAAHFIGLVAGKAIPSPVPYADVLTFTTHKVLRGPRGGMIVCKPELAQRIDKAVFPFLQGGPLMHAVAAKAVALKECLQPSYQAYAQRVVANAQALRPRGCARCPVAPTPTSLWWTSVSSMSRAARPRSAVTRLASP